MQPDLDGPDQLVPMRTKSSRGAFRGNVATSSGRASLELSLSRTSLQRMMKELALRPYRPRLLHALNEDDPDRRCEFADIFLKLISDENSFIDRVLWIDESIFKLNGHID
jgi:hypothetical protein